MTSFGWKRKLGEKICKEKVHKFSSESKEDDDTEDDEWFGFVPKKKALLIEDSNSKSERLKKEGIVLAETERFWEAISKWNEALQLTPTNETLMEMKAQALMSVGEILPALQAAQKSVELAPRWWVSHQTLGRALINIGEVTMAIKSFSRAIHLNPSEKELWSEDLCWAQSLLAGKEMVSNTAARNSTKKTLSIKELKEECSLEHNKTTCDNKCNELVPYTDVGNNDLEDEDPVEVSLVQIPVNYVHMRDVT